MRALAMILAADEGKALGEPPALLEHEGGRSFLRSLALNFSRAGTPAVALIGAEAERVREQHPDLPLVEDTAWGEGAFAQVRHALAAALHEDVEWILLQPVDMPSVRTPSLKSLVARLAEEREADGLRPTYEGAPGYPVVLRRSAAERLRDSDAHSLEAALKGVNMKSIPMKDPGVVVRIAAGDIYERLFGTKVHLAPAPKRRLKKATA